MSNTKIKEYVGTYRVIAEYDEVTGDFPRDSSGNIDPSFEDLYIKCAGGIKIKHGIGKTWSCYIPNKNKGKNLFRQIYIDKVSPNLPTERSSENKRYLENLCNKLSEEGVVIEAEILDDEAFIIFHEDQIEYIFSLVKPQVSGKGMSPFSIKNLPHVTYKIPEEDLKEYSIISKQLLKENKLYMLKKLTTEFIHSKEFKKIIKTKQQSTFVYEEAKLKNGIQKDREFLHSLGKEVWGGFISYLQTSVL